jgi:hypothetical protein
VSDRTGGGEARARALEAISRIDKHSAELARATEDRDAAIRAMHNDEHMTAPQISRALAGEDGNDAGVSISNVRLILNRVPRR